MNRKLLYQVIMQSNMNPTTKSFLGAILKNDPKGNNDSDDAYTTEKFLRQFSDDDVTSATENIRPEDWAEDFFLYGEGLQPEEPGYQQALEAHIQKNRLPAYIRRQMMQGIPSDWNN